MSSDPFEGASFLDGDNAQAILEIYDRYLKDAASVDSSWHSYFKNFEESAATVEADAKRPVWQKAFPSSESSQGKGFDRQAILDSIRALMLIRVYRVRGHLIANFDPLKLDKRPDHPELDPKTYGFQTEADLDRPIFLDNVLGKETATVREIVEILKKTYCTNVAVEFMHIQDPEEKAWIQSKFENDAPEKVLSTKEREALLEKLIEAESFEAFLNKRHTGAKKFGLEGLEVFIPALHEVIGASSALGVKEALIGMAHRGRLNVLANVMRKPLKQIFSEFLGTYEHCGALRSGDVKYHQGFSSDQVYGSKNVHLSLSANPSHLEAVDPVVLGRVRAKQDMGGDKERTEVLGILVHGDAAFIGQGIVAECFGLSDLDGYRTGGTVHIVTNNQIGFTTNPTSSRSSPYCSEVAKIVQAPIFHVNADDPESVMFVCRLAAAFRQRFKKDVVVDIVGYRRYGHNESDDPSFTQPKMYSVIKNHANILEIYGKDLVQKQVLKEGALQKRIDTYIEEVSKAYNEAEKGLKIEADWLKGVWHGIDAKGDEENPKSPYDEEMLRKMGLDLFKTEIPGFSMHPRLKRVLDARLETIKTGQHIDWASAEALAFGTLVSEGYRVRLSGQDCGRGTFSQRHAVFVDQVNETRYVPLQHVLGKSTPFMVYDSPLSEFSVLGYEYGYSSADPLSLVLWEAQFGDFANGAQVIFDQFISSAESKWLRLSGLVVMLPHGYEGQGPEHSSSRFERYLQLCAENNMQVANCTTPANYFHILRRQLHRKSRKPLVLITPKSLLRHKLAVSSLKDMARGTSFQPVLPETHRDVNPSKVKRVVLSTGKVYYDLYETREAAKKWDVALVRVEQIYPWPKERLLKILAPYAHAEVVWCQEEPYNMGAWHFVDRRIEEVLLSLQFKKNRPFYVGRPEAASPATGFLKQHEKEQKALLEEALLLSVKE